MKKEKKAKEKKRRSRKKAEGEVKEEIKGRRRREIKKKKKARTKPAGRTACIKRASTLRSALSVSRYDFSHLSMSIFRNGHEGWLMKQNGSRTTNNLFSRRAWRKRYFVLQVCNRGFVPLYAEE